MRRLVIGLVTFGCIIGAGSASAAVNCAQVNRYLQTGRTAEEVAETMVISAEEVKKCQAQGAGAEKPQAPPPGGPATGGTGSAPSAPPGGGQAGH